MKLINHGSLFWARKIMNFHSSSKQKKKHIIWSVFIVAFSVVPLIISIILINGMTEGIIEKYIDLQSGHIQVYSPLDITETEKTEFMSNVLKIPEVDSCEFIYEGYGVLYSSKGSYSTILRGITEYFLEDNEIIEEFSAITGSLVISSTRDIVISRTIADNLGLDLFDRLAIAAVSNSSGQTFFKPTLLEVSGIINSGYRNLDKQLVFISSNNASNILKDSGKQYFSIRLNSNKLGDVYDTAEKIHILINDTSWVVKTWDMLNRSLFRNFAETKNILYVVMALIIMISGVNISSLCIMLIQENYINIGIMKAVGAPSRAIRQSFLLAVMSISFLGAFIGVFIGLLIGINLNTILSAISHTGIAAADYYLISIPIHIHIKQLLLVVLFTCIISYLSILIPLRRLKNITTIKILNTT
ncbi:MAG: ABC transporter permease [Spirochaetales bacterium]|nr:ABC transporter permease [Spirochaetales bacterium]